MSEEARDRLVGEREERLREALEKIANGPSHIVRPERGWAFDCAYVARTALNALASSPSPPDQPRITREEVAAKLADMRLHDETGDPHDEGFMAAVVEFEEWLKRMAVERDSSPPSLDGAECHELYSMWLAHGTGGNLHPQHPLATAAEKLARRMDPGHPRFQAPLPRDEK